MLIIQTPAYSVFVPAATLRTKLATWSDSGYTPSLNGLTLTGDPDQQRPTPAPHASLQKPTLRCFSWRGRAGLAGGWEHLLRLRREVNGRWCWPCTTFQRESAVGVETSSESSSWGFMQLLCIDPAVEAYTRACMIIPLRRYYMVESDHISSSNSTIPIFCL